MELGHGSISLTLDEIGLAERASNAVDLAHAIRVAAALDMPAPRPSERLPSLWHWGFFAPSTPTSDLGPDGHPGITATPLQPYPRRMWGAGRVEWTGDLHVGDVVERRTGVRSVRSTTGATGPLVIVRLDHEYLTGGGCQVREEQTLVYRGAHTSRSTRPNEVPALPTHGHAWTENVRPSAVQLFRFSAVTFNSHRIHYDLQYTRGVEGYPDLVVPGPFTATMLASFIERRTGCRLATFEFKSVAPLFVDEGATLVADPPARDDPVAAANVVGSDGRVVMRATYGLRV